MQNYCGFEALNRQEDVRNGQTGMKTITLTGASMVTYILILFMAWLIYELR